MNLQEEILRPRPDPEDRSGSAGDRPRTVTVFGIANLVLGSPGIVVNLGRLWGRLVVFAPG